MYLYLGGILGLLMVCCIDCIWPPRRQVGPPPSQQPQREDKKDSDVEELDDDDLEVESYQLFIFLQSHCFR